MARWLRMASFLLTVAAVAGAVALSGNVVDLYAAARWQEARDELAQDGGFLGTPTGRWLDARLSHRPEVALDLLTQAQGSADLDDEVGLAVRLDHAGILLGSGRPREVLAVLEPLLDDDDGVPGQVHLMAGLARRALGDEDGAVRVLSAVAPDDPAFAVARMTLGDLGLAAGEPERALRYYDNVESATADPGRRATAGRWQALRLLGDDEAADQLLADLQRRAPDGLSVLEIHRRRRLAADEQAARAVATVSDTATVTAPATATGRYTLQLGAFNDRALALELVRRHAGQIPDLRVDESRDERGQILYKVRSGSYVNPARARTAAQDLARRLDLEVFVASVDD